MAQLLPLFVAVVAALFFGSRVLVRWRRRDLVVSTPRVPIAELRSGMHMVRGAIRGSTQQFAGPMSDRVCVYYRFTVEEHRSRNKSSDWVTVVERTRTSTIELDDGTGHAAVDLGAAELSLALDRHVTTGLLSSMPEELAHKLRHEFGTDTKGWLFNKKMRVRETMLEVGDELVVIGQASFGRDGPLFGAGGPLFVVTDSSEARMIARETSSLLKWAIGGGVVVAVAIALAVQALLHRPV